MNEVNKKAVIFVLALFIAGLITAVISSLGEIVLTDRRVDSCITYTSDPTGCYKKFNK